jgi:hypothetical protein
VKKVKFYSNHPDNLHCVLAVFRSLFNYFFDEELSWKQIEKLMGYESGKGAWTFPAELELAKRGVEVMNIEPFDYEKFLEEGVVYLKANYNDETANYYITQTNIGMNLDKIPEFIKLVKHENRKATIKDVAGFLNDGYLVGAEIDASVLNKKSGLPLHFVLIKGTKDGKYIINDPGLPPMENRLITQEDLKEALGGDGTNGEVSAFRANQT